MEEKIPEAITGAYVLKLEDLIHSINIQKEKEKMQIAVIHEKETILQNMATMARDWQKIFSKADHDKNEVVLQSVRKIPTWDEILLSSDISTKRVLVNKLIQYIDITREKLVIHFNISLDENLPKSQITGNEMVSKQRL